MDNPPSASPFLEEPPSPTPAQKTPPIHVGELIFNVLTLLLLIAAVGMAVFYALIYTNPGAAFNPFPMPTPVPTLFIPSITPLPTRTATPVPPTVTLTASLTPTDTPSLPSPTAIKSSPIGTLTMTTGTPPTPISLTKPAYPFAIQGDPKAIDATLLDSAHNCTWMGVGGRVYDLAGGPATKIEVQLVGELSGNPVNETSLTGTAIQYGPSGYEFTLANKAVASNQSLYIRLLDQSGVPLSDKIYFNTFADCSKNLVVINFKQVR